MPEAVDIQLINIIPENPQAVNKLCAGESGIGRTGQDIIRAAGVAGQF